MISRNPRHPPTIWSLAQLEADSRVSTEQFRHERMTEPLEAYLNVFEEVQDVMDDLLEGTVDLTLLEEQALNVLSDPAMLESVRYLTGPPISLDDLKVLTDTKSLAPAVLQRASRLVQRLILIIRDGLDHRRFPWISEHRKPTPDERQAAVLASSALIASQRVATLRRTEGKIAQEALVKQALIDAGLAEISARNIQSMMEPPLVGQFCTESMLGTRKADLVVRLWDNRIMAIECKVSNSSTNSVKRLNNDAAVKAVSWTHDFGKTQVVPVAVLSGVYKVRNLQDAQDRGLTLYWAHRITDLTNWIAGTRS